MRMQIRFLSLFCILFLVPIFLQADIPRDNIDKIYIAKRLFKLNPGEAQKVKVLCAGANHWAMAGGVEMPELSPGNGQLGSIRIQESYPDREFWVIVARNVAGTAKNPDGSFVRPEVDLIAYATCIDASGAVNLIPELDSQGAAN